MSKVNDFCIVAPLGLLLTVSSDKFIRVFKLEVCNSDAGDGAAMLGQV